MNHAVLWPFFYVPSNPFRGGYIQSRQIGKISLFDLKNTTVLKGVAILLVIWGHVGKQLGIGGIQWIAGVGVSLFLICSGYGLEKSFQKNGLTNFWKKRVTTVIIPFYVVSLIGTVCVNGFQVSVGALPNILLLNTQWFLNYIVICYALYYFSTYCCKITQMRNLVLLAVFAVWFVIDAFFFASAEAPFLRGRQMGCFLLGVLFADHASLRKWFGSKVVCVGLMVVGIGMMAVTNLGSVKGLPVIASNFLSLFTVMPLALAVISLTVQFPRFLRTTF